MKIFTGKVVSNKMAKTVTVAVERMVVHPLYGKRYKKIKKYHVHDESGSQVGQIIKFVAGKPESKIKKWRKIQDSVKKPGDDTSKKATLKNESSKKSAKKEGKKK